MSNAMSKEEQSKGSSINYVVSKFAIFDPLPLLVVFLMCKISIFLPAPTHTLVRQHSLWIAPKEDKRMGREGLLGANQGFAGLRTFKEKGGTNGLAMYCHLIKISGKY